MWNPYTVPNQACYTLPIHENDLLFVRNVITSSICPLNGFPVLTFILRKSKDIIQQIGPMYLVIATCILEFIS